MNISPSDTLPYKLPDDYDTATGVPDFDATMPGWAEPRWFHRTDNKPDLSHSLATITDVSMVLSGTLAHPVGGLAHQSTYHNPNITVRREDGNAVFARGMHRPDLQERRDVDVARKKAAALIAALQLEHCSEV